MLFSKISLRELRKSMDYRKLRRVPENLEIVSLLVLGYAAEDCEPHPEMHASRKSLEETVFYGSFENLPASEKEQAQH